MRSDVNFAGYTHTLSGESILTHQKSKACVRVVKVTAAMAETAPA